MASSQYHIHNMQEFRVNIKVSGAHPNFLKGPEGVLTHLPPPLWNRHLWN